MKMGIYYSNNINSMAILKTNYHHRNLFSALYKFRFWIQVGIGNGLMFTNNPKKYLEDRGYVHIGKL